MIRNIVLSALVAVIFYCAALSAPPVQTQAYALAAPTRGDARAHRQFIPGVIVALHAATREFVAALPKAEPSA